MALAAFNENNFAVCGGGTTAFNVLSTGKNMIPGGNHWDEVDGWWEGEPKVMLVVSEGESDG
jgi:hypothetical protein